ncbi:MAG: polysaccharide pyruvyl transferase family protein [Phycisphaerales bacterium]|nr:polysaccharide pyruvyl transferase family protein [Phycisphaerales bacterium]
MIADLDELALQMNIPLVYMPQTFGPFESDPACRARAIRLLKQAKLVATREVQGLDELKKLLGYEHPHAVYCPDVAFSLPAVEPAEEAIPECCARLAAGR